jgi:hypothetical protein
MAKKKIKVGCHRLGEATFHGPPPIGRDQYQLIGHQAPPIGSELSAVGHHLFIFFLLITTNSKSQV